MVVCVVELFWVSGSAAGARDGQFENEAPMVYYLLFVVFVGVIELVAYTRTSAQTDHFRSVHAARQFVFDTRARAALKKVHVFLLGLFLMGYCCYAVLVLVWCLLGAIVNPVRFLVYAAGASTFLTFVATKLKLAISKYGSMKAAVFDTVAKVLANKGDAAETPAASAGAAAAPKDRSARAAFVMTLAGRPLRAAPRQASHRWR